MSDKRTDPDAAMALILKDGFVPYEHETLKPGVRIRNRSERYPKALANGTATVIVVMRKEGNWEQKYGRKNLEVLVRRDPDHHSRPNQLSWWADYGTVLVEKGEVDATQA